MKTLHEAIASAWDRMNPTEPSPRYLATFLAVAALSFLAAFLIGQL